MSRRTYRSQSAAGNRNISNQRTGSSPSGRRKSRSRVLQKKTQKGPNLFTTIINALKSVSLNAAAFISADKKRKRNFISVLGMATFIGLIILIVYVVNAANAYSIQIDGVPLCTIKKVEENITEEITKQAVMKVENELGTKISITGDIKYVLVHASKKDLVPTDEAIIKLSQNMAYQVEGFAIVVEGTTMAILPNVSQANNILDSIKEPYFRDGVKIVDSGFVEDVKVESRFVDKEELTDVETAFRVLTATMETGVDYTVTEGDNLYVIALKNNITVGRILSLNPAISEDTVLQIGQKLSLTVDKPLLSVFTIEEIKYIDVEPKPVQTLQNPNEPSSYQRTTQYGSVGQAEVTAHIKRINGMEISNEDVERNITVAPVPEIIEVGTSG